MFYKTGKPVSFRRPFHMGEEEVAPSSPPLSGNFPNYWGWEFDSDLVDTTGTYIISGGSATFPSGGAVGNYWDFAQFSNTLQSAPNDFIFSWGTPWAITGWVYLPSSNRSVNLAFYEGTIASEQSWVANLDYNQTRLVVYDTNNDGDIGDTASHVSRNLNQWQFVTIRYDPVNNKQVDSFTNGVLVKSRTYSLEFKPNTDYLSSKTLRITYNFGNERFDQLAIWYGSVLTDQNITDLYNNGSGMTLP